MCVCVRVCAFVCVCVCVCVCVYLLDVLWIGIIPRSDGGASRRERYSRTDASSELEADWLASISLSLSLSLSSVFLTQASSRRQPLLHTCCTWCMREVPISHRPPPPPSNTRTRPDRDQVSACVRPLWRRSMGLPPHCHPRPGPMGRPVCVVVTSLVRCAPELYGPVHGHMGSPGNRASAREPGSWSCKAKRT